MSEQQEALTLDGLHQQVERILDLNRVDADPEGAHCDQDGLYVAVLQAVAAGHPDAQPMAREVLRIEDEGDGTRWYS